MVKMRNARPQFLRTLNTSLVGQLRKAGIRATVRAERVHGTRLHRVVVLARKFRHLRFSERQDLIWRIANQVLDPDQQLQISMILTLTPDELSGK